MKRNGLRMLDFIHRNLTARGMWEVQRRSSKNTLLYSQLGKWGGGGKHSVFHSRQAESESPAATQGDTSGAVRGNWSSEDMCIEEGPGRQRAKRRKRSNAGAEQSPGKDLSLGGRRKTSRDPNRVTEWKLNRKERQRGEMASHASKKTKNQSKSQPVCRLGGQTVTKIKPGSRKETLREKENR